MLNRCGVFLAAAFAVLGWSLAGGAGAAERVLLDKGWRFHLGGLENAPEPGSGRLIGAWRWTAAGGSLPEERLAAAGVAVDGPEWADAGAGQDVFKGRLGFAWFRARLESAPGPHRFLHFESVDDNATVYLNGKRLAGHEGWDDPFDVDLDSAWNPEGPNELAVLVENTDGPGAIGETRLEWAKNIPPLPVDAAFDDSSWRVVHLPHDFVVEGSFDPHAEKSHGFLPKNRGWYRKTFALPASDRGQCLWIDFDGVYRDSKVWLNGQFLCGHASGYTGFRCDISRAARYGGDNILAVGVNSRTDEGWWYEGGGIYRHVWLNKAAPLHVEPWGVQVISIPLDGGGADIEAHCTLAGPAGDGATLACEVRDAGGQTLLAMSKPVSPGKAAAVTLKGRLPEAHLWSLEDPFLYRLVTQLKQDGRVLDRVETPFGIRAIRFDANHGFFLNGKPIKIKGVCNHQDFAGLGTALPDGMQDFRVEKLKEMGANAWRCSHNPPMPELLDACDRLGMLVMDENRKLGDSPEVLDQVKSMVLRDRNHPSIILWSLCNEEKRQGSPEGRRLGQAMKKVILDFDTTRPVTAAMNGGYEGKGLSALVDVQGFNYNIGKYDAYHRAHPRQPLFGSETASAVGTRGVYENDRERGYVSAYDVNAPDWGDSAEKAWRALGEREFMAGGFVWTGFDYKGEPTPYGWPCVNSHFGIMDICGFPKDSYYYYQAWWSGKPVLHLLPHWTWPGKEGQPLAVRAYSNCDEVELFVNGKSQGKRAVAPLGHVEWTPQYEPGVLSAKGFQAGRLVAQDQADTTGPPAQIGLKPFKTRLLADGEDVVPVEVSVLDAMGRVVPVAGNLVAFSVSGAGAIAGVGNGDPSCHEADQAGSRSAFNGRCLVLVRAGENAGPITLTAKAGGLKGAAAFLTALTSTAAPR